MRETQLRTSRMPAGHARGPDGNYSGLRPSRPSGATVAVLRRSAGFAGSSNCLCISSGVLISPIRYIGPARLRRLVKMARPERFELPTAWFVARYSIQLSYGRMGRELYWTANGM